MKNRLYLSLLLIAPLCLAHLPRGEAVALQSWSAAEDLGGFPLSSSPVAVSRTPSRIDVFYQGPNHHIWTSSRIDGESWSGAADLGGVELTSDLAAVSRNPKRIDLFYQGPNGHLWTSWWDGGPFWSAATDLGGVTITSAPTAVSRTPNRLDVFYQGPNGHLWTSWWDGTWWSAPTDLGGVVLGSAPAAVSRAPNRLDVFYKGPNGHLWTSWWLEGQSWSAPVDLGGVQLFSAPTAAVRDDGRIDVLFKGPSDHLWTTSSSGGSQWSAAADLGGTVLSTPGVVSIDGRRMDVFYRGSNGHLWLSNWTPLPPAPSGRSLSFLPPPPGSRACTKWIPPPSSNLGTEIDILGCYEPRPGVEVWSISNPKVATVNEVNYPSIQFRLFDVVSIAAGGCVQRGGSGFSWNRYVNPMDRLRGEDSQHYGSFRIPGVTAERRLSTAVPGGPIVIRSQPTEGGTLRLKYRDDPPGDDNGYYGHDWGDYEQCRDLANAWVVVTIQHRCVDAPDAQCSSPAPMDVISSQRDPNNLLLNAKWGWHVLTGVSPFPTELCGFSFKSGGMPEDDLRLCTNQPVVKDTNLFLCMKEGTSGRIAGHVNWTPATYTGKIRFHEHSLADRAGDNDYNFFLTADGGAGHTFQSGFFLEYRASEVSDRVLSSWWRQFKDAVERQDREVRLLQPVHEYANAIIGGKSAIIVGLLNIDCEHNCHVELHPVYAMAIHVRESIDDDLWAIFARNWGDEGYCSGSSDHPLNLTALKFDLPVPQGGSSKDVQVLNGAGLTEMRFSHAGMNYSLSPGDQNARVTVTLREPRDHSLADGVIHLRWRR